jgi:sugar/nucleoside kinase (ribokinase family)
VSATYEAVVAGHLCLDVIPNLTDSFLDPFEKTFLPGHTLLVGPVTFCTGGPVSNTGLALNKLGIQTQLMGKVGDDLLGQAVREIISAYGAHLADGIIVDKAVGTSYTVVISPPDIDRLFMHYPGANDTFCTDDVRYERVSETRLFHFGYPPLLRSMFEDNGEQLVEVFRRAKEIGVTTSLDMSLPARSSAAGMADWATILRSMLPYVDVFLPSIEETLYTLHRQTYEELFRATGGGDILPLVTPQLLSDLSQELIDLGVKIVGIKMGYRGLYLRTADQRTIGALGRSRPSDLAAWASKELWAPCFRVDVVGTTGAGDAAIAGFLSALLRDLSPEAAVTAAVAVGACNVEAADALSGILTWGETMDRVASGWARHELQLEAPGWRYDEDYLVWTRSSTGPR